MNFEAPQDNVEIFGPLANNLQLPLFFRLHEAQHVAAAARRRGVLSLGRQPL